MSRITMDRRRRLLGVAAFSAAGSLRIEPGFAQQAVPNSAGTEPPKLKVPANACDCHMHASDGARFPPPRPARMQPNGTIADYRLLQKRVGTSRTIVVTPSAYFTDNRVTL